MKYWRTKGGTFDIFIQVYDWIYSGAEYMSKEKNIKLVTMLRSFSLIVQIFTVHLSFLLLDFGIFYFMLNMI